MPEAPKPYCPAPQPLPARIADLTHAHLEEADEDEGNLVRAVLTMTLYGMDPERPDRERDLLQIVVENDKADDLVPGWVHGAAACVEGMFEMTLKLKLEEALQGVIPHKLGQRIAVEAIGGAGLAGLDNPGDGLLILLQRRIARRRKRALGLPVDERRERRDRRRLTELIDIVRQTGAALEAQIAKAVEREQRQRKTN